MKWLSEGGGPWGTGPRGGGSGGPWGGGGRGNGQGGGGGGSGPRGPYPPNLEEILKRSQDRFRRILPGGIGGGTGIAVVVIAIVVLWLASGFYRVLPDEVGVVLRFGAYNRTTQPGLNYHLPAPIESVLTPAVTRVNRTEIGYRSEENAEGEQTTSDQVEQESLMLTGDENIVDVNCTVFWIINDAKAYLFNIRDPEKTVKSAAESALREVIGENTLAMELSGGRQQVETDTHKLLQQLLDSYGAGIEVTQVTLQRVDPPGPVIAAFRDVQAALADQARLKNEAEAYRNDVVPKARGQATKVIQGAEAYRQQVVAQATGDAARFDSVYKAFKAAQAVTMQRLYLDTMEDILKHSRKVILDQSAEGKSGVLPYLPLPGLSAGLPADASSAQPPPAATENSDGAQFSIGRSQ
ncbi:MAG TPA: FtsH protease activity modulator HflK [Stellaceae bacterium]|nr:FtsH protease activity modulator HflK [Stellaceae bacterium]